MNLFAQSLFWLADPAHWVGEAGIGSRIVQHLVITGLAVALAAFVGLPLGIVIGHTRRGVALVGATVGAFRAIPTLGLLTIIGLGVGIGLVAPMLALIVLALPSLLSGAYAGVQSVDPAVVDAARAQGMTSGQVIGLVELPLAAAVIVGGLRTATLQVVATATLAAYVADYGLGRYLFAGLKGRDYPQMVAGSLLVTALALALEVSLGLLQSYVRRRTGVATPRRG